VPREIAVSFDYRCPFARNAHEAVVTALRDGADLDVRFLPFSLDQAHVEEGEQPVWERQPNEWGTGVTALLYGIAIRDQFPEGFFDFHLAAFAAEHAEQVDRFRAFGVPTFIEGEESVFIRFMERNRVDDLERALDLLDWTRLNEFKRTQIPR
jgi:hypothetical protein